MLFAVSKLSAYFGYTLTAAGVAFFCGACASAPQNAKQNDLGAQRENMEQIRLVIGANLSKITPCYEKAIDERPGAAGRMVVQWNLGRDGAPADVAIRESHESLRAAENCVLSEVRQLRFPPRDSDETLEIIYPFFFSENGLVPRVKPPGGE